MLSNAYFLAKFRFDTAENEPAKNLQNFAKIATFAEVANFATIPRAPAQPPEGSNRNFKAPQPSDAAAERCAEPR